MLHQALILTSHREYAQAMRQGLLRLGDAQTRIDVELDPLRATQIAPQQYDLIVIDTMLDTMDGLQLMQLLKQQSPACKFVVVSDTTDESSRASAYQNGAEYFVERPTTKETLDQALAAIRGLFYPVGPDGSPQKEEDEARVVNIADIVQMRCLSGDSVLLLVRSQFQSGDIFIFRGQIFHAQYPGRSGEAAFRDMMRWDGGIVKVKAIKLTNTPPRTIEASYRLLLDTSAQVETPRPDTSRTGDLFAVQGELPPEKATTSVAREAPPLEEPPPFPEFRPRVKGETKLPRVNSHWMVNLSGDLMEGSQVADPDRCAFITTFIYRKMADVAVALEVDYFTHMTLTGQHLQQVLVADNLGVRHGVFDAAWTTEEMRVQYVKWCCEQSF